MNHVATPRAQPAPPSPAGEDGAASRCPNCGTPAPLAFCPVCGQTQDVAPPILRRWVADALDDAFDLNARLPRTLRALVGAPGLLSAEWMAGRRARYLAPLRLYVLASLAMFGAAVALRFLGEHLGIGYRPRGALEDGAFAEAVRRSATQALFILVPLFAVWTAVLFRRAGRVYIEHVVFALHVHAFAFAATTAGYLMVFAPDRLVPWLQLPFGVWIPVYLVLAIRRVYGESPLHAAWKGGVLFVAQGVAITLLTLALAQLRAPAATAPPVPTAPAAGAVGR